MRIVLLIIVVLAAVLVVQASRIYKARTDLTAQVEKQLDFVDENSFDAVRSNLVAAAAGLGITLQPADITIVYEDAAERSLAQKILEGKVATFQNKRIAITVRYNASVLGLAWRQQIERSKHRQVQVRPVRPTLDTEGLTDPVPGF